MSEHSEKTERPYQPIACADYDVYEIAIMQNRLLSITWQLDSAQMQQKVIKPLSLQIIDQAEYLVFELVDVEYQGGERQPEQQQKVRLDKIMQVEYSG